MSGGEAKARDKGGTAVVGTGGFGFRGDAYRIPGGGEDGGGGEGGRDGDCNGQLVKWVGYYSNHNLSDIA